MPVNKPVYIISDSPELDNIEFGFDAYAKTLAELIANKENKTPLVIGIYGLWGSGKTTLMETVRRFLHEKDHTDGDNYRKCKTVWFQAWKYDKEDEILAALIEEILKAIKRDDSYTSRIKGEIEEFINKVNISKGITELAKSFLGINVADFMSEPVHKEKLGFYDAFQEFFERLIWTYTRLRPKFSNTEEPDHTKGALVVFIDDLDRCPEPRIITVFETIKLFMDKKGCVFLIGASEEIIKKALKGRYADEDAKKFLDKIVHVTFNLPQISNVEFNPYLEKIAPQVLEKIEPHLQHILPTVQNNPRRFKRFLNDLSLMEGLHQNREAGIDYNDLLFWKLVEFEEPDLIRETNENPETFNIFKEILSEISEQDLHTGRWEVSPEKLKEIRAKSLTPYLENRKLTELVRNIDLTAEQIRLLISLSGIARPEEAPPLFAEQAQIIAPERGRKVQLEEMAEVPAGTFQFGDRKDTAHIERPFQIDIYPVTNRQFEAFIKEGGYQNDEFWSEESKVWRETKNITRPQYWGDEEWNQPEHPVVGVSYWEAEAYARWAGKRLPNEMEWERAARGTDGREYPWGNEFDKEKCNTQESGIGKTTRVTRYPNGISPVGCYDMAGNVWEWTNSWYDEDKYAKVLRGGSWYFDQNDARCAYRGRFNPIGRLIYVGFRCVRPLE